MRQIRSFEDAQIAIRELFNYIDYYNTQNIDMHQRRIKNASPSVDLYDYVVRKELEDLKVSVTELPSKVAAKNGYSVIFSSYFPPSGDPAGPGYVIQRNCTLDKITFIALRTHNSPALTINFKVNFTDLILQNNIVIDSSYTEKTVLTFTNFNVTNFSTNDIITIVAANSSQVYLVSLQLFFGG